MFSFMRWTGLALVAASLVALGTATADDDKRKGEGDKGTASGKGGQVMGRIASVDTEKRTIVLEDIKGGDKSSSTTATGSDKRTADKDGGDKGTADKGTGEKGRGGKGSTFTVSERAKITLDGSPATMKELRKGLYARVHTARAGAGDKGRTTGGERDKDAGGTEGSRDKDKGAAGRAMTTDRVEAFTKEPRGSDRDR